MHKLTAVLVCSLISCASSPATEQRTVVRESGAPTASVAPEATPSVGLPNEQTPLPGVLTGGLPSSAQLELARAAGYKTVISLLPEQEAGDEAQQARAAGLRFWSIPIAGPSDLTEANAMQLSAAMNERGARPLIIHCASGNRVGALLALKAYYIDHESKEAAIELGERAGLKSLKPVVEDKLK